MSRHWPYSPGDTLKSANDNDDKDGLASGQNDYDDNSMFVFRKEAFESFFAKGTVIWSQQQGFIGQSSSGFMYNSATGDRIQVPAVNAYTFPKAQDTYVLVDGGSGTISYSSVQNAATAPDISSTQQIAAIISTDNNGITSIVQAGLDNRGRYVHNTAPVGKQSVASDVLSPTGATIAWPGEKNTIPSGWLLCDGSEVSRTQYPNYFKIVGTAYGAGDGSKTFNLPNLQKRSPMGRDEAANGGAGSNFPRLGYMAGEEAVTLSVDTLPSHGHNVYDPGHGHNVADPGHRHYSVEGNAAVFTTGSSTLHLPGSGYNAVTFGASVTTASGTGIGIYGSGTGVQVQATGGGNAHNNLSPYTVMLWITKVV